jgi:hypothetical protein
MPKCYVNVWSHPYRESKKNPWMWISIKLMSLIYHLIWIHIQKKLSTWCEINMIDLIFCQINMVELTKPWFLVKLIWSSHLNHDHFDQPFIYLFIYFHPSPNVALVGASSLWPMDTRIKCISILIQEYTGK